MNINAKILLRILMPELWTVYMPCELQIYTRVQAIAANVESAEEREARLQHIRDRLAAKSAGERGARLQRIRINQSETGC